MSDASRAKACHAIANIWDCQDYKSALVILDTYAAEQTAGMRALVNKLHVALAYHHEVFNGMQPSLHDPAKCGACPLLDESARLLAAPEGQG